jgi:hypothetical protein
MTSPQGSHNYTSEVEDSLNPPFRSLSYFLILIPGIKKTKESRKRNLVSSHCIADSVHIIQSQLSTLNFNKRSVAQWSRTQTK